MLSAGRGLEKRTALVLLLGSFLVLTGLSIYIDRTGILLPPQQEYGECSFSESEVVEIYSLVVHHIYSDNSFPGVKWPVVFIDPIARSMSRGQATQYGGKPVPPCLMSRLKDLPAKRILFASRGEAIDHGSRVRYGGCFITLGIITFLGDEEAIVEASHYVGNLGASGSRYRLVKGSMGQWRIESSSMLWVS